MNKSKPTNIILLVSVAILGVVVFGVSAHAGYVPLEPSVTGGEVGGNMGAYLNRIYKLGIAIAGILAVLYIVVGGFQYMLSESLFEKGAGKERIKAALGGLILALVSWIVLNTINPDLVKFNIRLPDFKVDVRKTPPVYEFVGSQDGKTTRSFKTIEECKKWSKTSCNQQIKQTDTQDMQSKAKDTRFDDTLASQKCRADRRVCFAKVPVVAGKAGCSGYITQCDTYKSEMKKCEQICE